MLARNRTASRITDESGYSLIELLVVVLIIGILSAIAIPAFLGQTAKANDSSAKSLVRTAQTAAETVGTDANGSYAGITGPAALAAVESTISTTAGNGAYLSAATGTADSYTVTVTSSNGNTYTISHNTDGSIVHSCTVAAGVNPGGCVSSTW